MIRTYSQKFWPGAGDVDDCWVVATFMAVHAVAPWLFLPTVSRFRELAGKPDTPGPSGATVTDAAKAMTALWPQLAVETSKAFTWPTFMAKVKAGRPASLTLLAGTLPADLRYGFTGVHQVTVEYREGAWFISNPLALPHHAPDKVDQAALHNAVAAYSGARTEANIMPTRGDAFTTHPLYAGAVDHGRTLEYAHQAAGAKVTLAPLGQ